jgi:RNA polymerase sigma-70 factor (ECF subfamily)
MPPLRCRRHDAEAATELIAMFQRPLLYYLRRMVDSEETAWDLARETWMRIIAALPTLREPQTFPAFRYRVAHNAAFASLRKRQLPVSFEEAGVEPEVRDGLEFSAEDAARVHAGSALLPLAQREALTLHFLEDLSLAEIAHVQSVPIGTVKSRLFHASRPSQYCQAQAGSSAWASETGAMSRTGGIARRQSPDCTLGRSVQ